MIDAMCPPAKRPKQNTICRTASNYKLTDFSMAWRKRVVPVDILMYLWAQMNRLPLFSTVMQVDYKRQLHAVQTSAPLKPKCACKVQGSSPGQTNDCSECQFLLSVSTVTFTSSHPKQTAFNYENLVRHLYSLYSVVGAGTTKFCLAKQNHKTYHSSLLNSC
jgi:hypothetical protein